LRNTLLAGTACLLLSAASAFAQTSDSYKVYFGLNQSSLDTDALQVVSNAATAYQQTGSARVTVTGYTDLSGSSTYNERLSERRAEAVRSELSRLGVPDSSISVTAAGESDPAVPTPDGVPERENRRVEIVMAPPPAAPAVVETAPVVPAPAPVMADTMDEGGGLLGGRFNLGALYGFNMQDGDEEDQSSHLAGLNLGFNYNMTDFVALSLEQAVFYNFFSEDDGFGGRTAAGLDFTVGFGDVIPYIGANIGYLYGSGIEDDWFAGPEVGLNLFGFDAKVAYDMPWNRDWEDGVIVATVGLGLKF
jgi:hypothetical protein